MTQQTPVLVGISHLEQRFTDFESAKEPVQLMIDAVNQAAEDAGSKELLNAGSVRVIRGIWPYEDPARAVAQAIGRHGNPKVVWLQEEPRNMGAWSFMHEQFHIHGHADVQYVGRGASASPASGSPAVHQQRHDALLEEVVAMAKF